MSFIKSLFGGQKQAVPAARGPVRAQSVAVPSSANLDTPKLDEHVRIRTEPSLRTVSPSKAEFMDEFNGLIQAMHSMHDIVDQSYDFMSEDDKRDFVRSVRSVAVGMGLTRQDEAQEAI